MYARFARVRRFPIALMSSPRVSSLRPSPIRPTTAASPAGLCSHHARAGSVRTLLLERATLSRGFVNDSTCASKRVTSLSGDRRAGPGHASRGVVSFQVYVSYRSVQPLRQNRLRCPVSWDACSTLWECPKRRSIRPRQRRFGHSSCLSPDGLGHASNGIGSTAPCDLRTYE